MHKKTSKRSAFPLTNKEKVLENSLQKTVHGSFKASVSASRTTASKRKSKKYDISENQLHNETVSWDMQSSGTSASWSEGMEETATRKVLQQWENVEKILYEEEDPLSSGALYDECLQWRTQLPHLRVMGKSLLPNNIEDIDNEKQGDNFQKCQDSEALHYEFSSKEPNNSNTESRKELREYVFDQLVEYICSELVLHEREVKNSLSNDLDDVLKITPAPTYSSRNPSASSKNLSHMKRRNLISAKLTSENVPYLFDNHKKSAHTSPSGEEASKNAEQSTVDDTLQKEQKELSNQPYTRNRPGMIFDEKVMVSPVPFVVSTRESFRTLKTYPIHYIGQPMDLSIHRGILTRSINSAYECSLPRRTSLTHLPEVRSAWQTPANSTIALKNVKLAPISVSTLPNPTRRRKSGTTSAMLPNCQKKSLSPISQAAVRKEDREKKIDSEERVQLLEIQGTRIRQSVVSHFSNHKSKRSIQRMGRR